MITALPLSIAPMIDWTNSPFRVLMRFMAPHALLYTEMQTTGAINNNPTRALSFNPMEHPIAIQLGGSDPTALAISAEASEKKGFNEINLNLGCPSHKVQSGRFGACLMREPEHVSRCILALKQAVTIPITAKIRIGIDTQDSFRFFSDFAHRLVDAGCEKIIVHARKAWLHGLNPKQNRTIPPINYDYVYQLKQEIPHIPIVINGNILTINEIQNHLRQVDGVMLGRLACDNPFYIASIHQELYPKSLKIERSQLFSKYLDFLQEEHQKGVSLTILVKPLFNLLHGVSGASLWKKKLMSLLQTRNLDLLFELKQYLLEL